MFFAAAYVSTVRHIILIITTFILVHVFDFWSLKWSVALIFSAVFQICSKITNFWLSPYWRHVLSNRSAVPYTLHNVSQQEMHTKGSCITCDCLPVCKWVYVYGVVNTCLNGRVKQWVSEWVSADCTICLCICGN